MHPLLELCVGGIKTTPAGSSLVSSRSFGTEKRVQDASLSPQLANTVTDAKCEPIHTAILTLPCIALGKEGENQKVQGGISL